MADLSDVEQELVNLIAAAIYPNGSGSGSSIGGVTAKIYRGWPGASCLDADLKAGTVNITVFPRNVEKVTTRYFREFQTLVFPTPTLTATVVGNQITIGGIINQPQNVVVLCGLNNSFSYPVKISDSLTLVATGVAAAIAAVFPGTTSSGPVVTVAGHPGIIQVRMAAQGVSAKEVKRQDRQFQITLWCPTPALRDTVAKVVDPALAAQSFIPFADGTNGFLRYDHTTVDDDPQKEQLYRRDLFYWVEYPTIITEYDTAIGVIVANLVGGQDTPPDSPPDQTNI